VDRSGALARLGHDDGPFDVVVVGGGATGLGVAVDAASRGYRTLLAERDDFAKGTSSRSTKLIHGGVRYLRGGRWGLVRSALREREILLRNAPHVVREQTFVVPTWRRRDTAVVGLGLALYDALGGRRSLGRSRRLSAAETAQRLPGVRADGLRGGVLYHDARFDDARLAIHLARTAAREGAVVANHVAVVAVARHGALWAITLEDRETGARIPVAARAVVNATGPFADAVRRLADPAASPMLALSRGTHLVLDRATFPGETALLVPDVGDGRVAFLIPWHERVLLGTTDVPVAAAEAEPRPSRREVDELLGLAARVLERPPRIDDVRSLFAGLRPLAAGTGRTPRLPRDHVVRVEGPGRVTVVGGKWTTYRRMARDAVDRAADSAGIRPRPCRTATLAIDDVTAPAGGDPLRPGTPVSAGDVIWAARHEMARTVEDVLARRTGTLFTDARAARALAPEVARVLAAELGRDASWALAQEAAFRDLVAASLPEGLS